MKRRKTNYQFLGIHSWLLKLLITFYFCGKVSGQMDTVQVKIGGTANFTWKFEFYSIISLNYKGSPETLAVKSAETSSVINPNISADFKGRISFNVNDKRKTATFLLKDVVEKDDGKSFELEIETKTKLIKFPKQLTLVEVPSFIETSLKSVEKTEGTKLILKCSAKGKPTPKITWMRKDTGFQLSSAFGSNSLIFEAINRTDQGPYSCRAANIAGGIVVTTTVNVNYPPTIEARKSSTTAFSYVGNPFPVTLKCFATGYPKPTYQWKGRDNKVLSNSNFLSLKNPTDSQLGIVYQCVASNKIGTSKPHSVMVKKLEKPGRVIASIIKKDAKSLSIKWVLPSNTGGGDLINIIIDTVGSSGIKSTQYPAASTNTTFNGLSPYNNYTFKIRVKNELLESTAFILKARTAEAAPSAPVNFRPQYLDAKKERQILIVWSPPLQLNGILRNYEVAYGNHRTFDVERAKKIKVDKNAVATIITNLQPFERYSLQMRAVTIEPGPWTEKIYARTAHEAPTAPRNVSVEVFDAHMVRVTWKSPEFIYGPISTAEVYLGSFVNGKWANRNQMFYTDLEQRNRVIGGSFSKNVIANTKHRIQVREASGVDLKWGPFSQMVFFRTPEGVPSVPKDVKVTHRTSSSLSLSWQMPSSINGNLTHFIVFYENSTQQYKTKIDKDLGNQTFRQQLVYLKESTKYTLMVQAFTAAGGGARTIPLETSTIASNVAMPLKQPDDEISAGPIIGGIFSFLVILVLLIILILFIARKQRSQKKAASILENQQFNGVSSPEERLLTPATDEQVPDVVTTNGNMQFSTQSSIEGKLASQRTFISSRPIKLTELKEVCDRLHLNKDAGFVQEFKSIRRENEVTSEISDRAENKCKNRYANIVAYDHSRVILSYIENIPGSDYINANYIDGYNKKKKFIATQGPVAASFGDFWRMVWEQNSHIIVMVTNLIEKSRIKCQKYWPTGDAQQFGSITVTPEEEIELADYVIRQFSVVMLTGKDKHQARKVTQFQFTGWPDHGVPQYATALLHFVRRVRNSTQDDGPIICHCSAGVGRTGTYITLDSMLDEIRNESFVDVHGCLTHMRAQRNYMVQTEGQYAFIHDALLESVICGDTEIHVKDLSDRIKELEIMNQETNKIFLEEEFDRLSYNLEENHIYEAGLFPVNATKNRFSTILPIEATRLKLWPYPSVEGSDYINANFVDGYQQREAFILTQAPLENTVEDFWRMIWEYEIYSIVMLTSPEESDSNHCYPYWPTNSEPANVGLLLVQIAAEEERAGYVKRDFRVTNSKTGESRVVTHFMYYDWPEDASPSDLSLVIDMIGQLQRTQQMTGNGSIAVHCSDGCGRSGSLCAIMFCIERLKLEGVVDVFQTVRLMRTQRPQIIRVLDHYLFCYNVVKKFVDKFSDYANFK